jgi:5-hydroxyisourate hydrolase-like protein (transthyretin family)
MGISIRVFDSANGRPAVGLPASLSRERDGAWHEQARDRTDADGYLAGWRSQPPGP